MKAEIITVGDEILYGQTINTNASFIGLALTAIGIKPSWITTVGDEIESLSMAIKQALDRVDCVIMTGGLGPTDDDLTFACIDSVSQMPIFSDCQKRTLNNCIGSAEGVFLSWRGKFLFALPGVPSEMKCMMTDEVIPLLKPYAGNEVIQHRFIHTSGIRESDLAGKILNLMNRDAHVSIAFLPGKTGVTLRLTAHEMSKSKAEQILDEIATDIYSLAGQWIYGENEADLAGIVGQLLTSLRLSVSVAESCTGGLVSDLLTNVPGSSLYFDRSIVTYSNKAKTALLDIPESMIAKHGAVSEEVAKAMARGIRQNASTDYGLSITGIAGPSGGTQKKPVGTVFVGLSSVNGTITKKFTFSKDRLTNKTKFAYSALNMLRIDLLNRMKNAGL
ncbi:nicotinamide-nucleotide amidohydrolase family protein [bacterium]|nr:nicotinamide-nucleotide amidohydrolase family protein [candidate division CSSED10-310 bacterium]